MAVCFGDFAFDPAARTLLRQGRLVHLTPKAFKLLEILVDKRPNPIERSDLMHQLWPSTHVSDGNLSNLVSELRRALDDEQGTELVSTVHSFGYAFICEAREGDIAPATKLGRFRVLVDGREIGLADGENWIGRSPRCRVQVYSPSASRRHARIVIAERQATIEDGPSTHGTIVNSERITGPTTLRHGDLIRIGSVHFSFIIVRPDAPTDKTPPL